MALYPIVASTTVVDEKNLGALKEGQGGESAWITIIVNRQRVIHIFVEQGEHPPGWGQ
jgi:hypothetical protein